MAINIMFKNLLMYIRIIDYQMRMNYNWIQYESHRHNS